MSQTEGSRRARRLNEAAAEYFRLRAVGQAIDRQEWLRKYADLADDLGALLHDLDHLPRGLRPYGDTSEHATSLDDSTRAGQPRPAEPAQLERPDPDRSEATVGACAAVGPYQTLVFHARGALGEILRGTDPQLHRTVAIKRLQDRLADDPESRRRFLLEAEVTARLEHPGVVPVFGLFYEQGDRPAYAMRFVEGPTLWDEIQRYHAGPPDAVAFHRLLQAFVDICQTVAYAHSRGIIHRDLKPHNVMIGKFGEALVMDWGLAKIVGRVEETRVSGLAETTLIPGSGSGTGSETALGSAIGTPAYMSPEQAAGRWDVIDHAADVYGLGAVLYAVLTGKPPLEGGNWPELQQRIQRGEFARPREVNPQVPRPLEAVCLKAMALRPAARYSTAAAVAVDVERFLADESVTALPDTWASRGRRWLRRHRRAVVAAVMLMTAALVAATSGVVLLGQKNREIVAERNAARDAASEAEALNSFLTEDLLGQADPDVNSRDDKVTVEELLARAALKIDGNAKFAQRPSVEAAMRLVVGKTLFKLGNLVDAETQLRRAVDLRRAASGPDDPETLAAQETLADFLNRGPEKSDESEPLARQTWEARQRVLGPDDPATLDSLDTYASAVWRQERVEEAVGLYRQCLDGRRRVRGPDHVETLGSLNNLGLLLSLRGDWEEAVTLLRDAVAGREGQELSSESFAAVGNYSMALYAIGELDEAERLLGRYVPLAAGMLTDEHPSTQNLRAFRARVWLDQGRAREALPELERAVATRRAVFPAGNWRTAAGLVDLGRALLMLGRSAEAEAALAEARAIYRDHRPPSDYYTAWADSRYAEALMALQRPLDAEPLLLAAEKQLRGLKTCPRRHYRHVVEQLVSHYEQQQQPDEVARWQKLLD
jgi:serine/threonine protein kinase